MPMETLVKESSVLYQQDNLTFPIQEASAVVCQRNLSEAMIAEAKSLLANSTFEGIKKTGSIDELQQFLAQNLAESPHLLTDSIQLLQAFAQTVPTNDVRLAFMTVRNSMCKKLHTDITDYRLLCTYQGVGTEFVDAKNVSKNTDSIAASQIESLTEGDVILFRGAMSADDSHPPLLHKSPAVNDPSEHRLLLRLDTNMTAWG